LDRWKQVSLLSLSILLHCFTDTASFENRTASIMDRIERKQLIHYADEAPCCVVEVCEVVSMSSTTKQVHMSKLAPNEYYDVYLLPSPSILQFRSRDLRCCTCLRPPRCVCRWSTVVIKLGLSMCLPLASDFDRMYDIQIFAFIDSNVKSHFVPFVQSISYRSKAECFPKLLLRNVSPNRVLH
jgi:hypothetical protein